MKIKSLVIVGLFAFTSCANQAEPIYITNFFSLAANCDTGGSDKVANNGYLDVAAGSPQYFVGVAVAGGTKLKINQVQVGTTVLEPENRNRPIITQMVVTYRLSKRVGATPKPYVTNMSMPFLEDTASAAVQLISPDLGTQLFDGLAPSPGVAPSSVIEDFVDISADVEFKGELSATRTPFTTGTLTFPIRAFRSNPIACTNGYVKFASTAGAADFCSYVGQTPNQSQVPEPPSTCCLAVGSGGGAGC